MKNTKNKKIATVVLSAALVLGSASASANEGFNFDVSGVKIEGNVGAVWDYMAKIDVTTFTEAEFKEFRQKFTSETVRLGGTIETAKSNLEFSAHRIDRPELIKHFFPEKIEVLRAGQVSAEVTEQRKAVVTQADKVLETVRELKVQTFGQGQEGMKSATLEVVSEAKNAMTELQRIILTDLGFKIGEVKGLLGSVNTTLVVNEYSDVERDLRRVYETMSQQFDKLDTIRATATGQNPLIEGLKIGDYVQVAFENARGELIYREGKVESISRGARSSSNMYILNNGGLVGGVTQGSIKVYNVIAGPTVYAQKLGFTDMKLKEFMNSKGLGSGLNGEALIRQTRTFFFDPVYEELRRSERSKETRIADNRHSGVKSTQQKPNGLWGRIKASWSSANKAGSTVDIRSAVKKGKK